MGIQMEKKVLILEDNVQTAKVIEKVISGLEYKVNIIKADSIEMAYKSALEKTIDVFIIDIILDTSAPGDTSGIAFADRVRKLPKYLFTPMIFITALADPELYAYRNIHCFGYIEKPFSVQQVSTLLNQALNYSTKKEDDEIIYLRRDGILYSVHLKNMVYLQVQRHVMKIFLQKENIEIPYKTIKSFLEEADSEDILQCNRYTVVNRQYIDNIDFSNRFIKMQGISKPLEIGMAYKKSLMKKIDVV